MKAIILAAGIGERLMPLTENVPKPLVEINGITLLERMIRSLIENKITDIVITTGFAEDRIKDFIKEKYPEINITYVKNPIFGETNYIYSLWLAKEVVKDDDIILIHGDMLFDPMLMKRIVESDKSCALIKNSQEVPEKDFKARIKNGLITEIGVNVFGEDARFCAPLYKILKPDFEKWVEIMEEFVKENKVNCYAEDALNVIADKIKFHPVYYNDEFAMEIDNLEDLEKARKHLEIKEI